jgi:hypothetical protein
MDGRVVAIPLGAIVFIYGAIIGNNASLALNITDPCGVFLCSMIGILPGLAMMIYGIWFICAKKSVSRLKSKDDWWDRL